MSDISKKVGVARQTNPTALLDGQDIKASFDDVGRQVMTVHQVRDLVSTAYAAVTTGTPTTLISGDSGYFLDLVEISFSTNSTVASTNLLLKDDGTTVRGIDIPVDDTVQLTFPVPVPQGAKGGDWTIDMEDVTGTTVYISATFVRNI